MLDIDYTGMFSYEKVKEYINTHNYKANIELYKKLYNYYLNYHLTEFNKKEIIDIKIILGISHKYNYEYDKTKSLIYRLCNELIQARFHLAIPYLLFLKTKDEKETYIDECIDYYLKEDSELSLRSVCNFLENVIELNNIDKLKYREKYADACMIQAKNNTGIRANHWVCLALPKYKEIGAKKKYQEALEFYNNNINSVMDEYVQSLLCRRKKEITWPIFNRPLQYSYFFRKKGSKIRKLETKNQFNGKGDAQKNDN